MTGFPPITYPTRGPRDHRTLNRLFIPDKRKLPNCWFDCYQYIGFFRYVLLSYKDFINGRNALVRKSDNNTNDIMRHIAEIA